MRECGGGGWGLMGRALFGWGDRFGLVRSAMRRFPWWGAGKDKKGKKEGCPPAGGRVFLFASERLKQASSLASKKKNAR